LATDGDRYLAEQDGLWASDDVAAHRARALPVSMDFQAVGAYARPLKISRS
jgi:hypothetical protein